MRFRPFLKRTFKTALAAIVITVAAFVTSVFLIIVLVIVAIGVVSRNTDARAILEEYEYVFGNERSRNKIASIPVSGFILGDEQDASGLFDVLSESVTYGYNIKSELMDLANNSDVAGVILEIHSPGGTIYGSKAIADGVAYYREKTGKPTMSFIAGLAASGGYWAAVSTDTLYADTGSVLGSIGIVSGPFKYYDQPIAEDGGIFSGGVVTNRGIQTLTITAGKYKDMGNPYRKLTDEEILALQRMADSVYEDFVNYVSVRRGIERSVLVNDVGALVFDPKAAGALKLVDGVLNREESYARIAQRLGFTEGEYQVVRRRREAGLIDILIGAAQGSALNFRACPVLHGVLAYYGTFTDICR